MNQVGLDFVATDDLLVQANRVNSGLDRTYLGRTASASIKFARVPVLVNPPQAFSGRASAIYPATVGAVS